MVVIKSRNEVERIQALLMKASTGIAQDLDIQDAERLGLDLFEAWMLYVHHLASETQAAPTPETKANLLRIARAADALSLELQSLGPMGRGMLHAIGANLADQNPEAAMCVDVEGLPKPEVQYPFIERAEASYRWIERLNWLASLADQTSAFISQRSAKGGRKSFWAKVHGSSRDELARECMKVAASHGCGTQSATLKMVQAVLEAEHGKSAMRKMDGKPSDRGRKAVRKLAQTKPENGAV